MNQPESASFFYEVNLPPRHELQEANMDEKLLIEAASISGGAFYQELSLNLLPDHIEQRKTPYMLRQEVVLWNWLTFLLFVGLITLEWLLRKFANLA